MRYRLTEPTTPDGRLYATLIADGLTSGDHLQSLNGEPVDYTFTTNTDTDLENTVLFTNGGPHPDKFYAVFTSGYIPDDNPRRFPFAPGIVSEYTKHTLTKRVPINRRANDIAVLGFKDSILATAITNEFNNKIVVDLNDVTYPDKYLVLSQSKIIVYNRNHPTAQWEAASSGGILMATNHEYNRFGFDLHHKHRITFNNQAHLLSSIWHVFSALLQNQALADSAWNSARRYHTAFVRMKYVLNALKNIDTAI